MPSVLSFIRLDETLRPSRYRLGSALLLAFMMAWLIGHIAIEPSYRYALWLLLVASLALSQLLSKQLLAISSLPTQRRTSPQAGNPALTPAYDWHIQWQYGRLFFSKTSTPEQTSIYQARLLSIKQFGLLMVCHFELLGLQDNGKGKLIRLPVWCDQLSDDGWRQLCVLARLA